MDVNYGREILTRLLIHYFLIQQICGMLTLLGAVGFSDSTVNKIESPFPQISSLRDSIVVSREG